MAEAEKKKLLTQSVNRSPVRRDVRTPPSSWWRLLTDWSDIDLQFSVYLCCFSVAKCIRTNVPFIGYCFFTWVALFWAREVIEESTDKREIAWTIGGTFVVLTVPLALNLSLGHLRNFVEPRQQSQIIRIIWTVPVYAISAWLCLRFPHNAIYIQCVREVYEAYVIYCFLQYLVCYLDREQNLAPRLALKPAIVGHHKPPFCCLPPWTMGAEFLDKCKTGVLQFVVVRFCTTIAAVVLQYQNMYDEGHYDPRCGFFWVAITNSVSQGWALYVLFLFYHATHKDLVQIQPFGKFLCIKAIVFFSYWQGVVIGVLLTNGQITDTESHSAEIVARAIKDLLVGMEMYLAAIAYQFMFPVSDFVSTSNPEVERERTSIAYALWASCLPLELQDHISQKCREGCPCCCEIKSRACLGCSCKKHPAEKRHFAV